MERKDLVEQQEGVKPVDSNKISGSRRTLLKGAPALLVLANKPAFAGTCSISGFMSARVGTSLTTHDPSTCYGWSPGNWKNYNGHVDENAWNIAVGVTDGDLVNFNSFFNTSIAAAGGWAIYKLVNGVREAAPLSYTSLQGYTMHGALSAGGSNQQGDIVRHAAASYLNARFVEAGWGGGAPDPWMPNYPTSASIVVLYLLYELSYLSSPPSGVTYEAEGSGTSLVGANLSISEYASYFVSIANGSAP